MEERQRPALIRPYVLGADDESADRPPDQSQMPDDHDAGVHHSVSPGPGGTAGTALPGGSDPEAVPASGRRSRRGANRRRGGTPRPGATDASLSPVRTGTHRSDGVRPVTWRPAAGGSHRKGVVAALSVLGVAATVLFVTLKTESNAAPEAAPTAASSPVAAVGGNATWFTPSAPGTSPFDSAAPAPPSIGPPTLAPGDDRVDVPDRAPIRRTATSAPPRVPATGSTAGRPPARPGSAAPPPQNDTAYRTIQGETFDGQQGVRVENNASGSGVHLGFISTGDWVRYDDIGFTDTPAKELLVSASNAARQNRTGRLEVRLDSPSQAPVGSLTIPNNGDWFAYTTYTVRIRPTTGVHTVYLTFTSDQNEEFANVDWFRFQR